MRKKKYLEPASKYAGLIESKYLDRIKQKVEEEDRSFNTVMSRLIKDYCKEKYGVDYEQKK